jgi:hypothetical protein
MLKKRYRKAQFIFELILLTIIFSLCILIGFESQNLDLKEADKITSIVADRGIDSERGIKGKQPKYSILNLKISINGLPYLGRFETMTRLFKK